MTYLQIVNRILRRLRENEVTTVNQTPYSTLIGDLVNVVKNDIETMWDWDALRGTFTVVTLAGRFKYGMTGAGNLFKIQDVVNDTSNTIMYSKTSNWFTTKFTTGEPIEQGSPIYYSFNGVSNEGNAEVDIFPIPDGVYNLRFNGTYRSIDLVEDTDIPLIYDRLLIEGVVSRAISERGDDGGFTEQENRFANLLSDYIALEANRREDEITWQVV